MASITHQKVDRGDGPDLIEKKTARTWRLKGVFKLPGTEVSQWKIRGEAAGDFKRTLGNRKSLQSKRRTT